MTHSTSANGVLRALAVVLGYGALFVVFETQTALFEAAPGLRVWAPVAGLNLALLTVFGLRYVPVVLAALLAGGLWLGEPGAGLPAVILTSLAAVGGYAAAAAWLRRALSGGPFYALRLVGLVTATAFVLPAVVNGLIVLALTLAGQPGGEALVILHAVLADALGILTLTPLLLLAAGPRLQPWVKETLAGERLLPRRDGKELAAFALELGGIALALFLAVFATAGGARYLCLVALGWIAWRRGLARAVGAVALLNVGFVAALYLRGGTGAVGEAQLFMGVLALAGLLLGALVSERMRARAALDQTYRVLEARLAERVAALRDARSALEAQVEERRRVEDTLQGSVNALKASRDELKDAIAHQEELNRKLAASEHQLKELNARKDKFFSIVSHDVKSLLVSAIGFSKLLVTDAETLPREMVKEFAAHVHSSTTNTYDLLENLLTWTRMQTGRMYYQRAWHGVNDLIENNLTMLKDNAARKGIVLKKRTDRDAQVYADRNMINSVLQNLLSNAIKFTERGGEVTVAARSNAQTVEIAVIDTGVGIRPEDQDKLFRIDVHHSSHGTEDEEGTGLGLVLCKEMIEKHEGRIWVESEPGKGAAFFFTLPCAAPDLAAVAE